MWGGPRSSTPNRLPTPGNESLALLKRLLLLLLGEERPLKITVFFSSSSSESLWNDDDLAREFPRATPSSGDLFFPSSLTKPPSRPSVVCVRSQRRNEPRIPCSKKRKEKGRKKKGWEGTRHHDNTGGRRTTAIKKYGGNVVHPVIPVPTQKSVFVCVCVWKGIKNVPAHLAR